MARQTAITRGGRSPLAPQGATRVDLHGCEIPTLPNGAPQPHAKPKKPSSQVAKPKKRSVSSLSLPAPKPAPDAVDETGDPQLCAPYASDIYSYLRSMEVRAVLPRPDRFNQFPRSSLGSDELCDCVTGPGETAGGGGGTHGGAGGGSRPPDAKRRPAADYIERVQVDVTPNMRGILVDWLVEVAEEYKLVSDTLYLTVSYIDRFLSANSLNRQKLQLLGVSAMLIASKYEEISPPNVEDFCYITDNTYMKQELVKMERDILNNLKFEMGNPTAKTFLRMFIKSGQEDKKYPSLLLEFMGSYLTELSLLDYGCVRFLPSAVAASAVFVARLTLNPDSNPWFKGVSSLLPPVGIPASYFEDLKE
uniref:Cyclin-A3-1 n=1 Tax=Aegilops tauschii TaxID=37682 RepID=M8BS03_AEGTA